MFQQEVSEVLSFRHFSTQQGGCGDLAVPPSSASIICSPCMALCPRCASTAVMINALVASPEHLGSSQQWFFVPEQGAEEPFGWDMLPCPLGGM